MPSPSQPYEYSPAPQLIFILLFVIFPLIYACGRLVQTVLYSVACSLHYMFAFAIEFIYGDEIHLSQPSYPGAVSSTDESDQDEFGGPCEPKQLASKVDPSKQRLPQNLSLTDHSDLSLTEGPSKTDDSAGDSGTEDRPVSAEMEEGFKRVATAHGSVSIRKRHPHLESSSTL